MGGSKGMPASHVHRQGQVIFLQVVAICGSPARPHILVSLTFANPLREKEHVLVLMCASLASL